MSNGIFSKSAWTEGEYRQAVKELRKHFTGYEASEGFDLRLNLGKTLSRYKKKKVRDQLEYLHSVVGGVEKRVYRPRQKGRIRDVMKGQGIGYVPLNLKHAFIPDPGDHYKTKVKLKKRPSKMLGADKRTGKKIILARVSEVETISRGVKREYIFINPEFLLDDPLDAVRAGMSLTPRAGAYQIQAGKHEVYKSEYRIKPGESDESIAEKIAALQMKYSDENENNYHGNWLGGLVAYTFPDVMNYVSYTSAINKSRRQNKAKRKSAYQKLERIAMAEAKLTAQRDQLKTLYKKGKISVKDYSSELMKIAVKEGKLKERVKKSK